MKTSILALVAAFIAPLIALPTAKIVNPYQKEIDAADAHAVLGDTSKRSNLEKRSHHSSDVISLIIPFAVADSTNEDALGTQKRAEMATDNSDMIIRVSEKGDEKEARSHEFVVSNVERDDKATDIINTVKFAVTESDSK